MLVGTTGFEPVTSASPWQRATKLRYVPHTQIWYRASGVVARAIIPGANAEGGTP